MYQLSVTSDEILETLCAAYAELPDVLARVRKRVPSKKREIAQFQAAVLYSVVKPYNLMGAHILEIGTFIGYSAAIMAEAAPLTQITTLNPRNDEASEARHNLKEYPNVEVVEALSWDYLADRKNARWDVVFVDGNHKEIKRDMPYWNHISIGGLFIHHDYSPADSSRPCPPVFDELNRFSDMLGREMDVKVIDDTNVGMAGWYRREGDRDYV